jgi:hypothetical protein
MSLASVLTPLDDRHLALAAPVSTASAGHAAGAGVVCDASTP